MTRQFPTFAADLDTLRGRLAAEQVTHVASEAIGVYWRPVLFRLEMPGSS